MIPLNSFLRFRSSTAGSLSWSVIGKFAGLTYLIALVRASLEACVFLALGNCEAKALLDSPEKIAAVAISVLKIRFIVFSLFYFRSDFREGTIAHTIAQY